MTIRVLLCDGQQLAVANTRSAIEHEADMEVIGEVDDGNQAVAATHRLRPDVVLMDIPLRGINGIEATGQLAGPTAPCPVPVIIVTAVDLDEDVIAALRARASGFLLKGGPSHELIQAIRAVAAGEAVITPSVTRRLLNRYAGRLPPPRVQPPTPLAALTTRELEVLRVLAQGRSNCEIAKELALSEATVKSHVHSLLVKLGLHDRTQAVAMAYETGFMPCCSG